MSRHALFLALILAAPGGWAQTDRLIVDLVPAAAKPGQAVRLDPGPGWPALSKVRAAGGRLILRVAAPLDEAEAQALAARLAEDPRVLRAEPDRILRPARLPDDPLWPEQWYLHGRDTAPAAIDLPAAWAWTVGDAAVTVAVVDTGVLPHGQLAPRLLPGYDFVSDVAMARDGDGRDPDASDPGDDCGAGSSWHGTFVAGQIGAVSDDGEGIAGVDWSARILPVRVLGACGGYSSDIADGIRWAAGLPVPGVPDNPHPARVINLSLGGWGACGYTLQEAIDAARDAGAVIVAAAGNDGGDAAHSSPGNCAGVVTVAAVSRDGGATSYTNTGAVVDLAAPGGDVQGAILSLGNDGWRDPGADTYGRAEGTSMAAPLVSGTVALMLALDPGLEPDAVAARLRAHARPFPTGTGHDCQACGAGLLDAAAVLAALAPNEAPQVRLGDDLRVRAGAVVVLAAQVSDPDGDAVHLRWTQVEGPPVALDLDDPRAPRFVAPDGPARLVFELNAEDARGARASDRIVVAVNGAPRVTPPPDRLAYPGEALALTAEASDDEAIAAWSWVVEAGPALELAGADGPTVRFTAPSAPGRITLRVTVTDSDGERATATVSVRVNVPPRAVASAPARVNPGETVTLDGSASEDPGDTLSYAWVQTGGPAVALERADAPRAIFVAPAEPGAVDFRLTVADPWGGTDTAPVSVWVNAAPVVRLSPPPAVVLGTPVVLDASASSDPDGDALRFTWRDAQGRPLGEGPVLALVPESDLTLTLTVRDALGLASETTFTLAVQAAAPELPPAPGGAESGDAPAAPPGPVAPTLVLGPDSARAPEDAGEVSLVVTRIGDLGAPALARWRWIGGDAEPGVDARLDGAELAWAAGEGGVREALLTVLDDDEDEGPETVILALEGPQGDELGRLTLTIEDDERPPGGWVRFTETAVRVPEGAGTRVIAVERRNGRGRVAVAYDSEGVEADGGDYVPLSGTLVWEDGETGVREIELVIHDDRTGEPDERLRLHLLPLQGGAGVQGVNPLEITLLDDDPKCFVATAAHGSAMAEDVRWLRAFRDQYLLGNAPGRALVDLYYRHSPPLAAWIARHETARAVVRALLAPLVWLSERLVDDAVYRAQTDRRP